MARKQSARFKNPPTGLAANVGRALGKLMAQRDRLMNQLSGVEEEIEKARAAEADTEPDPVPPSVRSRKTPAVSGRALSEASRRKLAQGAKQRAAATRTPNKSTPRT